MNIDQRIEKKKKEIQVLENKKINEALKVVKGKTLDVPELEIEVDIEVTHLGESWDEIMANPEIQQRIKDGWRILCTIRPGDYVNEIGFLENNPVYARILGMDGLKSPRHDFFVSQMFKRNADKGYVAQFYTRSDYSYLNSYVYSDSSNSSLGVRLCRKKEFPSKAKFKSKG